jgi:hypothetical protein
VRETPGDVHIHAEDGKPFFLKSYGELWDISTLWNNMLVNVLMLWLKSAGDDC